MCVGDVCSVSLNFTRVRAGNVASQGRAGRAGPWSMASGGDVRLRRGALASSADSQGTSHKRVEGLCREPSPASPAERVNFYPTLGTLEHADPLGSGDLLLRVQHRTLVGGPGACVVTALQLLGRVAGYVLKAEESRCRGQTRVRLGRGSEISEPTVAGP